MNNTHSKVIIRTSLGVLIYLNSQTIIAADDTISVVTNFYNALGNGDGVTAESFIIEKKQGKGAFKASNMSRFYSSMEDPLELKSVKLLDDDIALVTYTYTHDRRTCKGKSKVYTRITKYSERLIERIDANC